MDDDEKALVKISAEAVMKPFGDLINKLFGGPFEEIGGIWKDSLATRRRIRQVALFKKVQKAIDEAGIEPRQIPDNVWVPIILEASLEDDELLQDAWANLLSNAADSRLTTAVLPAFPEMLKALSSREVRFLEAVFREIGPTKEGEVDAHSLINIYAKTGLSHSDEASTEDLPDFQLMMDVLDRQRIMVGYGRTPNLENINPALEWALARGINQHYMLTRLGLMFVLSCRRPPRH